MKESLLMIGNDRLIFDKESAVAKRQIEYAKNYTEVHIVVFTDRNFKEISLGDNVWVYPTRSMSKIFAVTDAVNLANFIAKNRKIIKITTQDPWLTAIVGISIKKKLNIDLEMQVHGDIGSPYFGKSLKNKFLKLLALSNLPKADNIRVVSNKIKNYLIDTLHINESKIEVRPIRVDIERIKNTPLNVNHDLHRKYQQFSKIILMASRLEAEKNIYLALKSMKLLFKLDSSIGLIVVGKGGCENKLKKFVQSNMLDKNVIFESWADTEQLISYYKTCDIFMVTSDYEGYGMTLVEAKAAGARVVSTDVGIADEIGVTIVNRDPVEISNTIITLLKEERS
jgi:glycosyltransferase involved in cell wall biosynthesis